MFFPKKCNTKDTDLYYQMQQQQSSVISETAIACHSLCFHAQHTAIFTLAINIPELIFHSAQSTLNAFKLYTYNTYKCIILHLNTLLQCSIMLMDVEWDTVPCLKSWFMES